MIRKPGLWHGPRRVEVQAVKKSMRLACSTCGDHPQVRRLLVAEGVGRGRKSSVHCEACGDRWIEERIAEARRARRYLRTGEGSVRLG